uniref:Uncharacterized protein n=1 Tax=Rhizophora mucronata TaxID=61149 RepID=A0A2P2IHY3_RHIMU
MPCSVRTLQTHIVCGSCFIRLYVSNFFIFHMLLDKKYLTTPTYS